jgi:hypothetical protein
MYINLAQKFKNNLSFEPNGSLWHIFKNLHKCYVFVVSVVIIQLNHHMQISTVRVNV